MRSSAVIPQLPAPPGPGNVGGAAPSAPRTCGRPVGDADAAGRRFGRLMIASARLRALGHGLCAELFPERIALDDWDYPVVDGSPIPRALEQQARRAVDTRPVLALLLERRARRD